MKMKIQLTKNLLLILALTLTITNLFAQKERGSGNVTEEERTVSNFKGIDVASGVDIYLMQGNENKVVVKTDDNFQDNVKVDVDNGTLNIRISGKISNPKELDVYVTAKTISKINASSGSDVHVKSKLMVDQLELNMQSGSDINLEVEGNSLTCNLESGSDAFIEGSIDRLEVHASGGSDIKAKKLSAKTCKLRVSGGSDAFVNVTGEIDMEASGASDIHYSGNASVVHSRATGSSDIIGN